MSKETICVLPWMHFSVKPNGVVKPCCRFIMHDSNPQGEVINFSGMKLNDFINVNDILESDAFVQLREKMLEGKQIAGCAKCYNEEAVTGSSMRIGSNNDYDLDSVLKEPVKSLKYLEVTFGNYCNLACRTCNSQLSTSWYDDDKELVKHYKDRELYTQRLNIGFNWTPKDFKNTVHIKFTGGEPMLHPDFIKFLDVIIEGGYHNQIKLEIFTNSSWSPKEKLVSTLAKFKKTEIWMSIDGTGDVNDYVRQNSNWSDVTDSIDTWLEVEKKYDTISTTLTPTLCAYNVFNMITLIEYWIDKRNNKNLETVKDGPGNVVMNVVSSPIYIALDVLPNKQLIADSLNVYLQSIQRPVTEFKMIKSQINKITNYLLKNKGVIDTETFIKYTKDVDQLRNQSLEKQIPEVYNHLVSNNVVFSDIKGHIT